MPLATKAPSADSFDAVVTTTTKPAATKRSRLGSHAVGPHVLAC